MPRLAAYRPGARSALVGQRVLLIHPGIYDDLEDRSYPPWGALCVGEACRRQGAEVIVEDLNGKALEEAVRQLLSDFHPTVVGLTAKLGNGARRLTRVVSAIRAGSEVPIGIGGPLVSAFPDSSIPLWRGSTALFWGDGEEAFLDWVYKGCPAGDVHGPNETRSLDHVGIPTSWSGLGEYVSDREWWPGLERRSVHVSASRGCTRQCTFCYLIRQNKHRGLRVVGPEQIVADLDRLNKLWRAEGFYFVDDCLLAPRSRHTRDFLSLLQRRGAPYRLGCDLQLQELEDHDFLSEMYKAGFRSIYVGVELASASVRRRLGKGAITTSIKDILQGVHDSGFVVRASIGIGWPGESEREMVETLELIKRSPQLMFDAFRYTPLPGAPLTRHWNRGLASTAAVKREADPFEDYSQYSKNHSCLGDQRMDEIWREMRDLETTRHSDYFRSRPVAPSGPTGGSQED